MECCLRSRRMLDGAAAVRVMTCVGRRLLMGLSRPEIYFKPNSCSEQAQKLSSVLRPRHVLSTETETPYQMQIMVLTEDSQWSPRLLRSIIHSPSLRTMQVAAAEQLKHRVHITYRSAEWCGSTCYVHMEINGRPCFNLGKMHCCPIYNKKHMLNGRTGTGGKRPTWVGVIG